MQKPGQSLVRHAVRVSLGLAALQGPAFAAELPVPCVATACSTGFVSAGSATASTSGNTLTVTQQTRSTTLNWQSFDIGRDHSVTFVQPDVDSVALNRIFQADASRIFGNLSANGRVYLLNQNGIVFGQGAEVNVAGLIASSLDLSPAALNPDGSTNLSAAALAINPAFRLFGGGASGNVSVEQGASIRTLEGGQVLMFAPNVSNAGTISTPGGQAVLAAGDSVYLATSADPNLRGIMVEVGIGGTVTNGTAGNAAATDPAQLVGSIIAERGNITLAGAAVNQLGRVSATTSVSEGGSIRLIAREGGRVVPQAGGTVELAAASGGALLLGRNSITQIGMDSASGGTVDTSAQPISAVELEGDRIVLDRNAQVIAPHGNVTLTARANSNLLPGDFGTQNSNDSRIFLAGGAVIDVSGATTTKSVSENVIQVELRGDELADSELQRQGPLRGRTVSVDIRESGQRDDGTSWVGSPIGELSGWVATVEKPVEERSLTGGTVTLRSQGEVILDHGSRIDISGGAIEYTGGFVNTSQLLGTDGVAYDIASADPLRSYSGLAAGGTTTVRDPRWGVDRTYYTTQPAGRYEQGYVEGKDAGTLNILGQRVVLGADVVATTTVGRHQRLLPGDFTAGSGALYRPWLERPMAGRLVLGQTSGRVSGPQGPDYLLGDVQFTTDGAAPLAGDFDPWNDTLDESFATLQLDTELFGEDGIGNLQLRANGSVMLDAGQDLRLPAGGSLDVTAGRIDVGGNIRASGGAVRLTARDTFAMADAAGGATLRSGASIDVSGGWVNDTALANGGTSGSATLAIHGGEVSLTGSRQSVTLQAGSTIDASAGAQLDAGGNLHYGEAGSIDLAHSPGENDEPTRLTLDGELLAFGFDTGGSLGLSVGGACIAARLADCSDVGHDGHLLLVPDFFTRGGFSSYAVDSAQRGIEVVPGTEVRLTQQNLLATGDLSGVTTGTDVRAFSSIARLPDTARRAVDISLVAAPSLPFGQFYDGAAFATAPGLTIGTGAAILGEPGAAITLESSSRLRVDGTLSAPGGSIGLRLAPSLDLASTGDVYFEDQGIWLGGNALLSAAGALVSRVDDLGRISGEVLDGGRIRLDADRGHVIASAGSTLDVGGTVGTLDVRADANGGYTRREIGSAGGRLELEAAEGIVLGGTLRGASGKPGELAGGTLSVTLDASLRQDPGQQDTPVSLLPTGARVIELVQDAAPVAVGGGALPTHLHGRAVVAAEAVGAGGFDSLSLNALTYWTQESGGPTPHLGRIRLAGDVALQLAGRLDLSAPIVESDGGDALLSASLVRMGNQHLSNNRQETAAVTAGTGRLRVEAGQIDVIGTSVISGASDATLVSAGDLRFIGVGDDFGGYLGSPGNLTLTARQLFPATLTDFTIAAGLDSPRAVLAVRPNGDPGDVLSVGGALRLRAPEIRQDGVLRAPYGTLDLESPLVRLGAGSLTSTSSAGLSLLFGETQGGLDWLYRLGAKDILYGGDSGLPLPTQQVRLNGDDVRIEPEATVDVSGGGRLLASEFVAGTGGKRDLLGADNAAGSFAILPSYRLDSAAYDPDIWEGTGIEPGTTVHLDGTGQLPAGEYLVMPARYALLPGGFLVTPVEGFRDISSGQQFVQPDGGTIIAGHYGQQGGLGSTDRADGFLVAAGTQIQQKVRYTLTDANAFFAGTDRRLPADAGVLTMQATRSLELEGRIQATAASGARGAAVQIASESIQISAEGAAGAPTPGVLRLTDSALNGLGAESLVLGGAQDGDARFVTAAQTVYVGAGAELRAPEVVLAATDQVHLAGGARIVAQGNEVEAQEVSVAGDGAYLRVSTATDPGSIHRSGATGATGSIVLEEGATLQATGGAIDLEAAGVSAISGNLHAAGGAVSITGSAIALGGEASSSGWTLDRQQLAALDADTLSLVSRDGIDVHESLSLSFSNVNLETGELSIRDGAALEIVAEDAVRLTGGAQPSTAAPAAGSGSLHVSAADVLFAGGSMAIGGVDEVTLEATHGVRADSDARLAVSGALQISAPRVGVASGADLEVAVAGAAVLAGAAGVPLEEEDIVALGGSFELNAASIRLDTAIEAASGNVALRATDSTGTGVVLDAGAVIDVAGRISQFDQQTLASRGGSVSLAASGGDVRLGTGSRIDVSAPGGAAAGSIDLLAPQGSVVLEGELRGQATAGATGGSIAVDARTLTGFPGHANLLAAGGFTGDLAFRQRGAGDLLVSGTLAGRSVALTADQGSVLVPGQIRASGVQGGRIDIAAAGDIRVDGSLRAGAATAEQRNGRISLASAGGAILVSEAAVIATTSTEAREGSADDGKVFLRASQDSLLTLLDGNAGNDRVALDGDWSDVAAVEVEGYRVYTDADGVLEAEELDSATSPWYADAAGFAAQAADVATQLATQSSAPVEVLAGLELRSGSADGQLVVAADWNLAQWRFGGRPGVLTLRAAGDLSVAQSINDGFASASEHLLTPGFGDSWSYRLVAGADTGSADVMATRRTATGPFDGGSLILTGEGESSFAGNYTFVRTGNGRIDVAAAHDVILTDDAAMIYTAGQALDGQRYETVRGQGNQLGNLYYPAAGGDIHIRARGDVIGAPTDQFVTEWLWRIGNTDLAQTRSTAWTVNFERFHQGVGALGGGDVSVMADGDIEDLSVSVPSIGRQLANAGNDKSSAANNLQILGGSHLSVQAGGNLLGGSFHAGRGSMLLSAQEAIGVSSRTGFAPLLGLGDASAQLHARGDLHIGTALNPTLLPQGSSQGTLASTASYFSTYGGNSAVLLESTAGDLLLQPDAEIMERYGWARDTFDEEASFSLLPGTVRMHALRGQAQFSPGEGTQLTLAPAAQGHLDVLAWEDVRFGAIISDLDPVLVPRVAAPRSLLVSGNLDPVYLALRSWQPVNVSDSFNAITPVRLAAAREGTLAPSRLISAKGDVSGSGYFGGPLQISAGRDVKDLNVRVQNLTAADVTRIAAEGSVSWGLGRLSNGKILESPFGIHLDGPGHLLVSADGDIDLRASAGITSRGNLVNNALDELGAGISIIAGLNGNRPLLDSFAARYLGESDTYTSELREYLLDVTGLAHDTRAAAVSAFGTLSEAQREVFLYRVLLGEVRASAVEAASLQKRNDYSRGFAVVEAMFPGSTGDDSDFLGDLNLFFSRIYTLDGGDINLLTPGGGVNVGIAAPPTGFGVDKDPSELGLATRAGGDIGMLTFGDVQVNESRVFAINDSDIVVWSSEGDIDAGRGAKTAISAPEPVISYDNDGRPRITYSAALAGSGIQTRAASAAFRPGDVVLAAPRGVVNAGDAGIVAGNLTIAATAVLGADNIKVSGVAVGVPVDTGGLGASLAGVSAAASGAAGAAAEVGEGVSQNEPADSPLAAAALSWLDVFVTGVGEDNCAPDDAACLERQR